jgi:hypothetical protein
LLSVDLILLSIIVTAVCCHQVRGIGQLLIDHKYRVNRAIDGP